MITETVFEWEAMGRLFQQGLLNSDPNPVMAFFLVVAIVAVAVQPHRRPRSTPRSTRESGWD